MTDTVSPSDASPARPTSWRAFVAAAIAVAGLTALAAAALLIWADPFGLRQQPGTPAQPLLDSNQRFMFPQLVRSRQAEAVILGTSSVKLLDPERVKARTGFTTHNLAMNAATPWEQVQLMRLIRSEGRTPKIVIWGLDTTWCEADATSQAKQRTPRPFPDWLYHDGASLLDLPSAFSFTAIEIASRRLGQVVLGTPPRIRADGYDEFTPPDAGYDPARARWHLYGATGPVPQGAGTAPTPIMVPDAPDVRRFPALAWLTSALNVRDAPPTVILVLPPIHSFSLPAAIEDARCKQAIAAVARSVGAGLVDYRFRSPLTTRDENFWDPLHYRIGLAGRITDDLARLARGEAMIDQTGSSHIILNPIRPEP